MNVAQPCKGPKENSSKYLKCVTLHHHNEVTFEEGRKGGK